MSLYTILQKRHSVRAYKQDPVEDEKLQHVLEAALLAPTACNYQPFFIIVRKGAREVGELQPVYDREWFYTAPVVITVCCDTSAAWVRSCDGSTSMPPSSARSVSGSCSSASAADAACRAVSGSSSHNPAPVF